MPFLPLPATDVSPPALGPPTALLVTDDPGLRQQVRRLAESVGAVVRVDPAAEPDAFWWARAALVLLGPDIDPGLLPGPRPQLVHVTDGSATHPSGTPVGELLRLPEGADRLAGLLAGTRTDTEPTVVGLLGAVGGAGASTLACALALAGPGRVLLVDGDPLGAGLQTALGWEDIGGARWLDLDRVQGRLRPGVLTDALPGRGSLTLLSHDRAGPARPTGPAGLRLDEVLEAAGLDWPTIVVDLPRRCEPADLLVWRRLTAAVVVTPGTVAGVVSTARFVETLRGLGPRVAVVVRGGGLRVAEVEPVVAAELVLGWDHRRGLAAAAEAGDLERALRGRGAGSLPRRLWGWVA